MRHAWFRAIVLTAAVAAAAGQTPKSPAKNQTSVTGILVGRSGKPVANARIFLGKVADDQDILQAKIKLSGLPIARTDAHGNFQLNGFVPGNYTIVYSLAGGPSIAPAEIGIKALQAVTGSILPLMKDIEIGKNEPLDQRKWGSFTLLKGHTFWGSGANMKVWNATLRHGPAGPYLEVRKGAIWQAEFADKAQIKMEAWSY